MRAYSLDLRRRVIELVREGELTQQEIADLLGVTRRWAQQVLKRWRETGEIGPKKRVLAPRRIIPMERLKEYVAQHPDATLKEIGAGLGLSVSEAAICKALQRAGLPRKKKVLRACEQGRPDVQAKRRGWKRKIRKVLSRKLIFIDQTGVSTRMHRSYARAPAGQRVTGLIPEKHYVSSTLMGALNRYGRFVSLLYPGGTDLNAVLTFIHSQLAPLMKTGDIIVWDNLAAHLSASVVKAIESLGASVMNLPPYSPDLNPIEMLWSKTKTLLKGFAARTPQALRAALKAALDAITPNDVKHWFEHCGYENT